MSSPLIEFNNVYKQNQDNLVLNNITLKVNFGEIHALVGDNGGRQNNLCALISWFRKSRQMVWLKLLINASDNFLLLNIKLVMPDKILTLFLVLVFVKIYF